MAVAIVMNPKLLSLIHYMCLLHLCGCYFFVSPYHSKVIPIYLLTFAMAAHAYIMPYKRWWQNVIEIISLANFIIMLVLRSTQSVVTYLSLFPGTSISDIQGVQFAEPDKLTDFFSAFFYFPLGAAVLMGVVWIIYRLKYVCLQYILFELKNTFFSTISKYKIRNKLKQNLNGDVDPWDTNTPYVLEIDSEFKYTSY